jgi:cytochrome c peroxidase
MKTIVRLGGLLLIVLACGAVRGGDYICDGTVGDMQIYNNVLVKGGAVCVLERTEIFGNVKVEYGGALWTQGAKVWGSVQSYGAAWIRIMEWLEESQGTWVEGNVQIEGTQGTPPGGEIPNAICGSLVYGDFQLKKNYAPFAVGCGMDRGNSIGGNLQVEENMIGAGFDFDLAISIAYNTVSGDLQLFKNHSDDGGFSITHNEVMGNLQCQENWPAPEFADNMVHGDNECYEDGCQPSAVEMLGMLIFNDHRLSLNENQSCAACHGAMVGGTGPDSAINATGSVYEGSVPGRFGNSKPPASAYAGDSPVLHVEDGTWIGGMFWNGRATGWTLGDPLAEQAQGPFLNPLEQALPDPAAVVGRICDGPYAYLFKEVWGSNACMDVGMAYEYVGRSIAAFERSPLVSPFTSKFDAWQMGLAELTPAEQMGFALFNDPAKGNCAACHPSGGARPVFTDFTYDNLGVPKNPMNPFYFEYAFNPEGRDWVDEGLGGFLRSTGEPEEVYGPEIGKVKVPTLRDLDLRPMVLHEEEGRFVKAFSHNGYFKSIKEVVHFYNTRDVLPTCEPGTPGEKVTCWPMPEVSVNVNTDELGDLGLTDAEEDLIVLFLTTLSDGYFDACPPGDSAAPVAAPITPAARPTTGPTVPRSLR